MQVLYPEYLLFLILDFPGGASSKETACQCRRHKRYWFDPWVRKIPWKRARQPTPVFLPGESHGQRSLRFLGLQKVRHDLATEQQHLHLGPSQTEALYLGGEVSFFIQIHTIRKETDAEPKTA